MKRLLPALALVSLALVGCSHFEEDCKAKGGVVDSSTNTGVGVGVGANGKVGTVVTTSATDYCIVDGKVVAVE